MTCEISIIHYPDDLEWIGSKDWFSFHLDPMERKFELYEWIKANASDRVIILNETISQNMVGVPQSKRIPYKIFFENPDSAILFKLTWGGSA